MFDLDLIGFNFSIFVLIFVFFNKNSINKKFFICVALWSLIGTIVCISKVSSFFNSYMPQLNNYTIFSVMFLCILALMFCIFDETITRTIYFFEIIIMFRMMIRSLVKWIGFIFQINGFTVVTYQVEWLLIIVFVLIFRRLIGKRIAEDKEYEPSIGYLVLLEVLSVFLYMGAYLEPVLKQIDFRWYTYYIALEIIVLLPIMFDQYVGYARYKEKVSLMLEKNLAKERLKQYDIVQDIIQEINIKAHDLKHQINDLEMTERIDEYVSKDLKDTIGKYDTFINTGNDVIDAILTQKNIECKKINIDLVCILDGSIFDNFSVVEVKSLLGNLLDNAIEAQVGDNIGNKYIKIKSTNHGNMAKIQISNPCYDKILLDKNGIPKTNKSKGHGYGTKSIKKIVESHGGSITFSKKDNVFIVNILLS